MRSKCASDGHGSTGKMALLTLKEHHNLRQRKNGNMVSAFFPLHLQVYGHGVQVQDAHTAEAKAPAFPSCLIARHTRCTVVCLVGVGGVCLAAGGIRVLAVCTAAMRPQAHINGRWIIRFGTIKVMIELRS